MKKPLLFKTKEEITFENMRKIPLILTKEINGYENTNTFFVDSSGFGQEGEMALTINQFLKEIKVGYAYGIIEAGQFQVYISEFKLNKEKIFIKNEDYLKPIYEDKASFYKKAIIKKEGNKTILLSYYKEVAYIENGKAKVLSLDSQTTIRHIKEFLKQNGFKVESLKQIEKDYS